MKARHWEVAHWMFLHVTRDVSAANRLAFVALAYWRAASPDPAVNIRL